MLEHYDLRKKIELYALFVLLCIASIYGGFKIYPLFAGPSVIVNTPHDGDTVASSTFFISGTVKRVKEITIQGRPVPIDIDGHFTEVLVAEPPYTILVVHATDFYGATITKTIRVIPR
jgi:Glucodextranase, domain B